MPSRRVFSIGAVRNLRESEKVVLAPFWSGTPQESTCSPVQPVLGLLRPEPAENFQRTFPVK